MRDSLPAFVWLSGVRAVGGDAVSRSMSSVITVPLFFLLCMCLCVSACYCIFCVYGCASPPPVRFSGGATCRMTRRHHLDGTAGRATAAEGSEECTRVQDAAKAYILNLFKSKYTETEKKVGQALWSSHTHAYTHAYTYTRTDTLPPVPF